MDGNLVSLSRSGYFEISLDSVRAGKLHDLARLAGTDSETLARDLLSGALDQLEPGIEHPTALLDAIPGAFEAAMQGREDIRAGRAVKLADL